MRAILTVLLASAANLPVEHCYAYEDLLVLMPDRSGKIEFVFSEKTPDSTLEKVKAAYFKLTEDTRGHCAFSMPTLEVKEGWAIMRGSVYFKDINEFNYVKDRTHKGDRPTEEEHADCIHFHLMTRPNNKDNFILHVDDWLFSRVPWGAKKGPMPWKEIEKDRENIVKRTVTVPGKVLWREEFKFGFQRLEATSVTFERSPATVKKAEDVIDFAITGPRRVEYFGNQVEEADLKAFQKELEAAVVAWPKIKVELEQCAKKK